MLQYYQTWVLAEHNISGVSLWCLVGRRCTSGCFLQNRAKSRWRCFMSLNGWLTPIVTSPNIEANVTENYVIIVQYRTVHLKNWDYYFSCMYSYPCVTWYTSKAHVWNFRKIQTNPSKAKSCWKEWNTISNPKPNKQTKKNQNWGLKEHLNRKFKKSYDDTVPEGWTYWHAQLAYARYCDTAARHWPHSP